MPLSATRPRCGYDLGGITATWIETCPLRLTCSECGLDIQLGKILNARLATQWRFFETAPRKYVSALRTTAWRALRPWLFWRWVWMEYCVSVLRASVGVLVAMLGVYAAGVVGFTLIGIMPWVVALAISPNYRFGNRSGFLANLLTVLGGVAQSAAVPWVDRQYDMRWLFLRDQLDQVQVFVVIGVLTVIIMPVTFLMLPDTLRRARVRRLHLVRIALWSCVATPCLLQAVRLVSALSYSLTSVAGLIRSHNGYVSAIVPQWLDQHTPQLALGVLAVWLPLWWAFACGRYLQLPRPWLIAGVMLILSVLLAVGPGC